MGAVKPLEDLKLRLHFRFLEDFSRSFALGKDIANDSLEILQMPWKYRAYGICYVTKNVVVSTGVTCCGVLAVTNDILHAQGNLEGQLEQLSHCCKPLTTTVNCTARQLTKLGISAGQAQTFSATVLSLLIQSTTVSGLSKLRWRQ